MALNDRILPETSVDMKKRRKGLNDKTMPCAPHECTEAPSFEQDSNSALRTAESSAATVTLSIITLQNKSTIATQGFSVLPLGA